ncbi:MAG: hypothetical protein U0176_13900 [Bacteroidia bacterium]
MVETYRLTVSGDAFIETVERPELRDTARYEIRMAVTCGLTESGEAFGDTVERPRLRDTARYKTRIAMTCGLTVSGDTFDETFERPQLRDTARYKTRRAQTCGLTVSGDAIEEPTESSLPETARTKTGIACKAGILAKSDTFGKTVNLKPFPETFRIHSVKSLY